MQIGCIIQARVNSTRLPNKANLDIGGWPMWRHVMERTRPFNPIMAWAEECQCDEMDVLTRYILCARAHRLDVIMRVTSDCPLIDPEACQKVLDRFWARGGCYTANDLRKTYPDGLGCEVMSRDELEQAAYWTTSANGREHVTGALRKLAKGDYSANVLCPYVGISELKFSVDTQDEMDLVRKIDALLPSGEIKYRLDQTLNAYEAVLAQR